MASGRNWLPDVSFPYPRSQPVVLSADAVEPTPAVQPMLTQPGQTDQTGGEEDDIGSSSPEPELESELSSDDESMGEEEGPALLAPTGGAASFQAQMALEAAGHPEASAGAGKRKADGFLSEADRVRSLSALPVAWGYVMRAEVADLTAAMGGAGIASAKVLKFKGPSDVTNTRGSASARECPKGFPFDDPVASHVPQPGDDTPLQIAGRPVLAARRHSAPSGSFAPTAVTPVFGAPSVPRMPFGT
jgi:hypothetical protein